MDPLTMSLLFGQLATSALTDVFDAIMRTIWDASLKLLGVAFKVADALSVTTLSTHEEPLATVWPLMLWLSGLIALGLFFAQLALTAVRGGRGFLRLATGPVQYAAALALTVGVFGMLLAAADGATEAILSYGLNATNFTDALTHSTLIDSTVDAIKAVLLGFVALTMVIPVAIGLILEMIFRAAAISVLTATIPISAAGLVHSGTSSWFWRTSRWGATVIVMKPALALEFVLGLGIFAGSHGLIGVIAGAGVLVVSVGTPWVMFKLFAFIDPSTDAGQSFRDALRAETGISPFSSANPFAAARAARSGDGGGGDDAQQQANTTRFDTTPALPPESGNDPPRTTPPSGAGSDTQAADPTALRAPADDAGGGNPPRTGAGPLSPDGAHGAGADAATAPDAGASPSPGQSGTGASSPPPAPPSPSTGAQPHPPAAPGAGSAAGQTGHSGGPGEAGGAAGAGEAGVIV